MQLLQPVFAGQNGIKKYAFVNVSVGGMISLVFEAGKEMLIEK